MKNTILLYFRMILMMCINLYTSRIVLHTLGVEDYGIYNVVGGVVVMFSFLTDSMTASTQRFLTFELGAGNKQRLHEVFVTSIHIHFIISLMIIVLGETVGLWFLNEKMVIPPERMTAAYWCFHLSIFTAVLDVLSYPYISAIIAHEKMKSFAYIAILDAVLKLMLVYLLLVFDYDRLILYAVLYAGEKLLLRSVYNIYCLRNFEECRYRWLFEKSLFRRMASFAGWRMLGSMAYVLYTQGLNLLLNVFFGPVANAARATAYQAQIAVGRFSGNVQTAINPQITKTYASGQIEEMHQIIYKGFRLIYFILLILCLPLMVEAPTVLDLWLMEVPEGSVTFLRILLVTLLVQRCYGVMITAVSATGNIKRYEIIMGTLNLTTVPIAYIVLKAGGAPWSVFAVHLAVAVIANIAILGVILPTIKMGLKNFLRFAVMRCALVTVLSLVIPLAIKMTFDSSLFVSILNIILTVFSTVVLCLTLGLELEERSQMKDKINSFVVKFKKKN
ncbi:MAG: lipopolysaccharide biosynthesis protein [Bacteroidaceae bacterium]|nr:lipopolysaccharide biosynthesis protein [Bacteroidaceae bacterium]